MVPAFALFFFPPAFFFGGIAAPGRRRPALSVTEKSEGQNQSHQPEPNFAKSRIGNHSNPMVAVSLIAAAVSGLVLQTGLVPGVHLTGVRVNAPAVMGLYSNKHTSRSLRDGWIDQPEVVPTERTAQIVATLGPASQSTEMLGKLIKAGVNVFRLNSSHRQPGQFEKLVGDIRSLAKAQGKDVKILGDIQGPKFRCTITKDDKPVPLEAGSKVQLGLAVGDADPTRTGRITLTPTTEQTALMRGLKVGTKILLDDGFMEVTVSEIISKSEAIVTVVLGGNLKSRKGINVPELQVTS